MRLPCYFGAACALLVSACGTGRTLTAPPGHPIDFPLLPIATEPQTSVPIREVDASRRASSLPMPVQEEIDRVVADALAAHKFPGCVVIIGRRDGVVFQRAYGSRSIEPEVLPMTLDTVFDLASLTKPLATAASIIVLADRGLVDIDAPLKRYLPELGERGDGTLRQALTHTAGFVADTPLGDYANGIDGAIARIASRPLRSRPGAESRYSDAGFIVLGELVRRVTSHDLASFARENVFAPLGMTETGFLPGDGERRRAAPTEKVDGRWLLGEVHDPRARRLGGVAGHAGLFSTAADLAHFARAMLAGAPSFASLRALAQYTAPHDVPHAIRALGWDVHSAYSSNRGTRLSPRAFGHGGYTGTSLWVDPEADLFVIFLSNRVHPNGHGEANPTAGAIADLAAGGLQSAGRSFDFSTAGPGVETGLDVLVAERFARLAGRHVGLITNASGRTRDGRRDIDLFAAAPDLSLVAIFAPEHGLASDKDALLPDGRDAVTGLAVHSLYGEQFAPSDSQLAGIDTLVLNLPDVGTRFFTYASTLHRAMAVAATHGLAFVVLDRPNPIDGVHVEGPMPVGRHSFVNHAALPVRHGLTMGELALLLDAQDHLGTKLEVVRMRGWTRAMSWEATGLPWARPSPNLTSETEALLYPGIGLLEATNVSVGRGTTTPFEVVGAPFIDGERLANELTRERLPGVVVAPTSFTPTSSTHARKLCSGVRLTVTDRSALAPVTLGIAIAAALRRLYPTEWEVSRLAPLLMSPSSVTAIERGAPAAEVVSSWKAEIDAFAGEREKYFLYPRVASP